MAAGAAGAAGVTGAAGAVGGESAWMAATSRRGPSAAKGVGGEAENWLVGWLPESGPRAALPRLGRSLPSVSELLRPEKKAPVLRWLWKEDAVVAVVDFLEKTRVGCRALAEMVRARVGEDKEEDEALGSKSGENGPGPP